MSKSRQLKSNLKGSAALIAQSIFNRGEVKPFEPFDTPLDTLTRFSGIFTGMGYAAGYSGYFAFKCAGAILQFNAIDSDRGTAPALYAGTASFCCLLLAIGTIPLNTIDFAGSAYNTITNSLDKNTKNPVDAEDSSLRNTVIGP